LNETQEVSEWLGLDLVRKPANPFLPRIYIFDDICPRARCQRVSAAAETGIMYLTQEKPATETGG